MHISRSFFDVVHLITLPRHRDARGWFSESVRHNVYAQLLGLDDQDPPLVQSNVSLSQQYVLRGLHAQKQQPQGKLVQVLQGKIYDVMVDIRPHSPTFGQHQSVVLDGQISQQLWIPAGFAHGFLTLAADSIVLYHCSDYYVPNDQLTLLWNDQNLNINWPQIGRAPIVSDQDAAGISLKELASCVS